MILRPRQQKFRAACVGALKKRRNTLGIAPTGAGKTVMLSSIVGSFQGTRSLILQHRDELVEQNERTFRKVNPGVRTSFYTADYKRWGEAGEPTFSMIQTLARSKNLLTMPPLDVIFVDEAHHVASDSYIKVIERARQLNPNVMIGGVTATPGRGDSRNLRAAFDNVADQITLAELIRDGHLVRPRCLVIDTGSKAELSGVRKLATDFDMNEVEKVMNTRVINEKVVEKWREHAGDRRTVVFASNIQHATDITDEFMRQGVSARVVHGQMTDAQRRNTLEDFDAGKFQVLVNVAILTEGWDCQPVSCVVLLRPCSFKSTMIQMIGRGLRTVDPERYPGIHKDDCVVLDFGYSLLTHRDLEQVVRLEGDAGPKECPSCAATVPAAVAECPICGFEWPYEAPDKEPSADGSPEREETPLEDFVMTEIELIAKSPFRWEDFFDGRVTVADAIDAWASVINYRGRWVAVCGSKTEGMKIVAENADRLVALSAADDFLRAYGDDKTARKSKRWLSSPPTEKQLAYLGVSAMGAMGMSRYRASCAITWKKMERGIGSRLQRVIGAAA